MAHVDYKVIKNYSDKELYQYLQGVQELCLTKVECCEK